jgi:hypothetical protein
MSIEEPFMSTVLPTDSGYASIPNNKTFKRVVLQESRGQSVDKGESVPSVEGEHVSLETISCMADGKADVDSIYSLGSSIPSVIQQSYINEIADDLFSKICSENHYGQIMKRINSSLPRLLKSFASKIGASGSTLMHRDTMVFIRRYRR